MTTENNNTTPNAVVILQPNEIIAKSGIEEAKGQTILSVFEPYFAKLQDVDAVLRNLPTEEPTKEDMKLAYDSRQILKKIRTAAEKTKDEGKRNILIEGKLYDHLFGIIRDTTKPREAQFEQIEKYYEIKETNRLNALEAERLNFMRTNYPETNTMFINLRQMDEVAWDNYVTDLEAAKQARLKAEAERIEAERLAAEAEKKRQEEEAKKLRIAQAELAKAQEAARIAAEQQEAERKRIEAERKRAAEEMERIEREKQQAQQERQAAEQAKQAAEQARIDAERKAIEIEKARLESEKQAELQKREFEEQAKKAEEQAAELARIKAEQIAAQQAAQLEQQRLKNLNDSGKLIHFVKQLKAIDYPTCEAEINRGHINLAKERITAIIAHFEKVTARHSGQNPPIG